MSTDNKEKNQRSFGLTNLAVDNWVSMILLSAVIFIAGLISYNSMPKESSPEVVFPVIYVGTPYFGNSEVDIENLITRPIEKQVKGVTGIKKLTSTSIQDYSVIIAEFETGISIDQALQDVKDKVDLAKPDLPNDLDTEPNVFDINFSEFPIVTLNLSGNFKPEQLRNYAELLQDKIESLSEISEVKIKGTLEKEIKVDVDLNKMKAMNLTFGDIEYAIASENLTMSGGNIKQNNFERSIRIKGEFQSPTEIADIIVKSEFSRPIYLKDIATVTFGYEDPSSIARADENPVVSLEVIKKSGKNLLSAVDKIKDVVEDAKKAELPETLKINYFNDQSTNIKDQVSNLQNSIISGVILVVLVLLFFLGLRNALFVGIAIPLSMLMGILILYTMGITLNVVVLFSLILALGMLVDNSIVVIENIYRYYQNGYSKLEASKLGTAEVAMPIIASTATTVAAFIPLAFWPGIMGGFMKYMPITLIAVLSSSLFVGLVFNPVFTYLFMKIDENSSEQSTIKKQNIVALVWAGIFGVIALLSFLIKLESIRNLSLIIAGFILVFHFLLRPLSFKFQEVFLPALENYYDTFVTWSLKKWVSIAIFFGSIVLTVLSAMIYFGSNPKVEFFPTSDPQFVNAFIEMPIGTDINTADILTKKLESKVIKMLDEKGYMPIVENVLAQIGENTGDPSQPGGDPGSTPHKSRITVSFVKYQDRNGISSKEVLKDIRNTLKDETEARIVVDQNQDGPPAGKPINIEISGPELNTLLTLSSEIIEYVEDQNIPGIEELQADVSKDKPQLNLDVDRDKARRFGLSTLDISSAIRTAQYGKEVSKFKQGEDEYPIMVRLSPEYRDNINTLVAQNIAAKGGGFIPISAVTSWNNINTYSSVKRKDQKRVITIFSNVLEGYNGNEVVQNIKDALSAYKLPAGYSFVFTGEQEEQKEQMSFLLGALAIAGAMILLIIVAQFNSLIPPVIVLFAFLFSVIGVFLGYTFTNMSFVIIMSMVGIISLAGVVVNNAIVLMDYADLVRKERREALGVPENFQLSSEEIKQTIIYAGKTRLRPVLLTAITTVLGLIPLAIGLNIDFITLITASDPNFYIGGDNVSFWGPLAWTVIFGLIFATFLTLIVVPVMYWLFYKLNIKVQNLMGIKKPIFDSKL